MISNVWRFAPSPSDSGGESFSILGLNIGRNGREDMSQLGK